MRRGEEGAALLTVLLLVAVMAVLTAASLGKLKLASHLASNGAAVDQARAYAAAGESIAIFRIGDTLQQDMARTTLTGDWNGREVNLPIDGGIASARLSDGGNCFNLNSLVMADGTGGYATRPGGVEQLVRLMTLLDIDEATARSVATAAADWIDSDTISQPGGAEDEVYLRLAEPYRTANALMIDRSELRAVAGVTPAVYSRIAPFLCALPVAELTAINVNTLSSDRAALLAMLTPSLDVARARQALAARPAMGFPNLAEFWKQPVFSVDPGQGREQASLRTRWYNLRMLVELSGAEVEENALIDAAIKPAKVVRRTYGEVD